MMGRLALALALVAGTSSAQYFAGGGAPLTPAVEQALMHGAAPVAFPFDPPALPAELQARQQQQQQPQQQQQQGEAQPRFSEVQQEQKQPQGAQYADPRLRAEQEQLALWGREYAAQQQGQEQPQPQEQEQQQQQGQQTPVLLEQPEALNLPPADAVMQAALVETAAKAKGPAAATVPLAAKGIDLNEADAVEDATTTNQTPPRFTTNTASSDALPRDSTMQAEDHAAPLTPLAADAQADPAAEPRFAQSKTEAAAQAQTQTQTQTEAQAPTPIVGATMAGSSSSSSGSSLNLVSGIPPAPGQPIPNAESKRCTSVDDTSCAVKWSRGDIDWSTRTVPEGSLKEEMKTEAAKLRRITAADRVGVSTDAGLGSADFVMSNNPEIAAKQKAYVELHKQLSAEYDWVRKVRAVIRNYQNKVFNVQSHLTSGKAQLYRMKDDINKSIRKVKQDRLKYELKAAVDALAKLENHASALDAQAKDISASKNSLRATVAKIKLAMGRATNEDFTTQMRFQEQVLNKLPSQNEVKDAMRFAEANSANEDIKQAMSSLLQILDAQKPGHEDPRHAEEDEHELAAARSLPSPALIESRARVEDKAEAEAEAQVQAQAPVEHHRSSSVPAVHHKVYAVPHVAPPDTDLVGADVDPAITRDELNRQYEQVVRDTEAESELE